MNKCQATTNEQGQKMATNVQTKLLLKGLLRLFSQGWILVIFRVLFKLGLGCINLRVRLKKKINLLSSIALWFTFNMLLKVPFLFYIIPLLLLQRSEFITFLDHKKITTIIRIRKKARKGCISEFSVALT